MCRRGSLVQSPTLCNPSRARTPIKQYFNPVSNQTTTSARTPSRPGAPNSSTWTLNQDSCSYHCCHHRPPNQLPPASASKSPRNNMSWTFAIDLGT
nr:uncharacterized protein CTRU02_02478 [Colletotrichum truncatum]KAF6798504.1 hypothetical protein CTRU02_02478 [Colletotrichum truncatum]